MIFLDFPYHFYENGQTIEDFAEEFWIIDGKTVQIIEIDLLDGNLLAKTEHIKKTDFNTNGINTDYVQLNHSKSKKGVVRGLHFQWDKPMGKLMRVLAGKALLIAVDIRKGSPSYGKYSLS